MRNLRKESKNKNESGYLIYAIVGTLFLLAYLLFRLYVFSIPLIVISAIFYGILLNRYLRKRNSLSGAITVNYVVIPDLVILALWVGDLGSLLYTLYPGDSSEITVLFAVFLLLATGIGGILVTRNAFIRVNRVPYWDFSSVFYPSFLILIPFVILDLLTTVYELSLVFLFAFLSEFTISFFYFSLDSENKERSTFATKMASRKSTVTIYMGVLGFFAGLAIALSSSSFAIVTLLVLVAYIIGGLVVMVYTIYGGSAKILSKNSMTVFKKFEKEGSLSASHEIFYMGEALDIFESQGRKEELIIVVTKFLTERGKNLDYIRKSLKLVLDYKLPNSVLLGLSKPGSSVDKTEIEKRKKITKVVIENMVVIGGSIE